MEFVTDGAQMGGGNETCYQFLNDEADIIIAIIYGEVTSKFTEEGSD
jgi:hypothetical protein